MSFNTNKTWVYQIVGRDLQLWQYVQTANTYTLAGYRIKLPNEYYGDHLIYPNEDITNGLRIEYTALDEPFVSEAIETTTARASGTGISFDPGPAATISDSDDGFSDFAQGDKIRVIGSASNDGDYLLTTSGTVDEDTLTLESGTFTVEAAGESISIYQIPKEVTSPDESSHVNLSRTLTLAVIDYVKAQKADLVGEVEQKEYYMKEFYRKIGDSQSNKYKVAIAMAQKPFAIV